MHAVVAFLTCGGLAYHGINKGSLSPTGAVAAFLVGFPILVHPNVLFTACLIVFYLSSSALTKVGSSRKAKLEEDHTVGGQRNWIQVSANGLTATVLAVLSRGYIGQYDPVCFGAASTSSLRVNTALTAAFVAHFACCAGDTWASELGILSKTQPFLITTGKVVPHGTNGGITPTGLMASAAGGTVIGLVGALSTLQGNCFTLERALALIAIGVLGGLFGSLLDSFLGATLQLSTFNAKTKQITKDFRRPKDGERKEDFQKISGMEILDNHQVNYLSALITSLLFGFLTYSLIGEGTP
ncbi:Transmembrane protein 19 [Irineochytrium annulatum]|nr:Transmembrane protein 19 [Irineochytrium annulatum]